MEGTKPVNLINMKGTRPLRGQPYPVFKCGRNVKVNLFISALAKVNIKVVLILKY
jgi:hypothetical protein